MISSRKYYEVVSIYQYFKVFFMKIDQPKMFIQCTHCTVCKCIYLSPYGILLVELPLVAVLLISINNNGRIVSGIELP